MKLHYKRLGAVAEGGELQEKTPLIILHGLFGSSDNWQTLGRQFAERYDVILLDQRNHGRSPHSVDFGYEQMANDLLELIESLGLKRVNLVGHSMGGKTVMKFAQLMPAYVHKLVVVDMGVKQYPMHHQTILDGMHAVDFDFVTSRSQVRDVLQDYINSPVLQQFIMKNLYWVESGRLDWRINLSVLTNEMSEILGALDASIVETDTLFIRGEKSNYILDSDIPLLEEYFPQSSVETVYGAGHWVHAENAGEFYRLVIDFLDQ